MKEYVVGHFDAEDVDRFFLFLDEVRESGAINMFGAAVPLGEEFELDVRDAREVLGEWMRTFEERHPR